MASSDLILIWMISHSLTTNVKNTEFQKFFTCCALPFKSCYKNNSRNVCQSDNRKENQKVVTLKKNRNTILSHLVTHFITTSSWKLSSFWVASKLKDGVSAPLLLPARELLRSLLAAQQHLNQRRYCTEIPTHVHAPMDHAGVTHVYMHPEALSVHSKFVIKYCYQVPYAISIKTPSNKS